MNEGPRVALRGADADAVAAVEGHGAEVVESGAAECLLAFGEPALLSLATDPVDCPVLPVAPSGGLNAVARSSLGAALASVDGGSFRRVTHPVLGVAVGGEAAARAVADAMLLTSEPAKISEYAVHTPVERVERFRADGVVVATPLGSSGYAGAAGGPTVAADAGVSVVPVSPFSTGARTWVLTLPLSLTVERDEGPVTLLADAGEVRTVGHGDRVRLRCADSVDLAVVPETGEPAE